MITSLSEMSGAPISKAFAWADDAFCAAVTRRIARCSSAAKPSGWPTISPAARLPVSALLTTERICWSMLSMPDKPDTAIT
ncbi:hypothetical protein G6F57_021974 [Rhizopus arrhizus]|nr:hypothetical protein G6F57_021974 [Rhizopus arrhizus]